MITASYLSKDQIKVEEVTAKPKTNNVVWYHCVKPSDDDLDLLEKITGVDRDHLEIAHDDEIHPYADKETFVELVYRVPLLEQGDIVTEPLIIFFKKKFVITMAAEKLKAIAQFEKSFAQNNQRFILKGTGTYFVHELLDAINDDFLNRINRITRTVDLVEKAPQEIKHYESLYNASLTSAHFNRALLGNIDALNHLKKMRHQDISTDDRDNFIDLHREALQILDTERIQRELIANLFTFQNVIANQKVERKLRRITILAVLITVPTLISGIYGMNVKLPMAENPFAFWYILALMVVVSVVLVLIFRMIDVN